LTESFQAFLLFSQLLGIPTPVETGRLSTYHPNDGSCGQEVACGGAFTWQDRHIAYRRWYKVGCGRVVLVHAVQTDLWVVATVQDGGPYGVYRGRLRRCVEEGRYRIASRGERRRGRPRRGWKWRGLTDLSYALWVDLGRPSFLSEVRLYFLPFQLSRRAWRSMQRRARPFS
jgi:hypothetical protein